MIREAYDYEDTTYVCDSCGRECELAMVDFGIGPYEFWGAKGCHVDKAGASVCCESTNYFEGGEKLVSSAVHVARKKHRSDNRLPIEPGTLYRRDTYRVWREGGGSWYASEKRAILYAPGDGKTPTRRPHPTARWWTRD